MHTKEDKIFQFIGHAVMIFFVILCRCPYDSVVDVICHRQQHPYKQRVFLYTGEIQFICLRIHIQDRKRCNTCLWHLHFINSRRYSSVPCSNYSARIFSIQARTAWPKFSQLLRILYHAVQWGAGAYLYELYKCFRPEKYVSGIADSGTRDKWFLYSSDEILFCLFYTGRNNRSRVNRRGLGVPDLFPGCPASRQAHCCHHRLVFRHRLLE